MSGQFLLGQGVEEIGTETFPVTYSQLSESAIIHTTAKDASLPIEAYDNMDHGHQRGFWGQHRSQSLLR